MSICLILGLLLILNAFIISLFTGFNVANFLTLSVGSAFIYLYLYQKLNLKNIFFKLVKTAALLGLCYFLIMGTFIFFSSKNTASFNEDAAIILGSGIKGEFVTPALKKRLDTGIDYLNKNPKAVVILSGGKGRWESIPEAEAMKRYLLANGVAQERILTEEKSKNTTQNIAFSKAILDKHFEGKPYKLVCITSAYHSFRAKKQGEILGLEMTSYSSSVPFYLFAPGYLRESLSLPYFWWRKITAS